MFKWELINDDTGERLILINRDGTYGNPHGWEKIALEHNRSEKYDGIFLDFSRDLSFHCKGGGKEMLDEIYEDKGSEGNATLKCYFSCGGGNFKLLFEGFVNFASYKEEFKGKKLHTTVEIRKKGITQTVMSRDETDVDLLSEVSIGGVALNAYGFAPYTLNLHSRIIYIESKWQLEEHTCCVRYIQTGLFEMYFMPNAVKIKDDITETKETSSQCAVTTNFDGIFETATPILDTANNELLIEPNTFTVEYDFAGYMNMTNHELSFPPAECEPSTCGTMPTTSAAIIDSIDGRLRLYYGSPTADELEDACASNPQISENLQFIDLAELNGVMGGTSKNFHFSGAGSLDIILQPGDRVWLYWVVNFNLHSNNGDEVFKFVYSGADIRIFSNTQSAASEAKAVAIHEAWSRVCEGITDQTLAFKSEFFGRKNSQGLKYDQNGYGSFTAILDGLRIRGYEKSLNAVLSEFQTKKGIITTLKDMYDSCNAVWGIGLGIETHEGIEVVRVEEKNYFYQDVEVFKISNIPDMEMQFAEDMAYSEVQLGFEKWKTEEKGGLDEPLTIARWIFPKIKNIKNVKELTSPFVAGMYAIEKTRRKKPSATEDSQYDDDIFFIATSRTREDVVPNTELTIAEKNENIWVDPTTLLAPDTAYNLRFNLFSNFDRTMNQFTTNLTKDSPQQIKYSYLEGNGQMTFAYFETSYDQAGNLNKLGVKNVQDTEIPSGYHQRQYPILLPEVYTFTYALPFSDYLTLLDNPYGYISFSSTEKNYKKGYIKEMSYNIARQMAEFTLIRKFD